MIDHIAPAQSALPFALSIQERFEQYHAEHPEVFAILVKLCYQLRASGHTHYGIKGIWERARWHFHVERGMAEYKLNNNFTSRYVRLIVAEHPDFAEFFETRELRA